MFCYVCLHLIHEPFLLFGLYRKHRQVFHLSVVLFWSQFDLWELGKEERMMIRVLAYSQSLQTHSYPVFIVDEN